MRFTAFILFALTIVALSGCNRLMGSEPTIGSATTTPPVRLTLSLSYEQTNNYQEVGTCEVPAGSATGSSHTCTISVPEGQLFYGDMRMSVDPLFGTCAIMVVRPYFYLASTSNTFTPNWNSSSTIDCGVAYDDLPTDCFNGAGKTIIPDFPKRAGMYFIPTGTARDFDFTSPNTLSAGHSTRYYANNLATGSRGGTFAIGTGDGYTGTFQDWTFVCQDEYLRSLYTLVLTIEDVDDSTAASLISEDQAEDWKPY